MLGRTRAEPVPHLFGPDVVHHAGVQALELVNQHRIKERAGEPSPQVGRTLGRQILPTRLFGVADERPLN